MSYVNGTTHYNLPQTVGTDKRDWFDSNAAFAAVDAALYAAATGQASDAEAITALQQTVAGQATDIATLQTASSSHAASISALQTTVNGQATQIADVRQDAEDMITANNEGAAATSTRAYVVGDYFIYNDVLYKATDAIAIGDTIVPNTNCEATNVDTELTKLNSDLANITDVILSTGYTILDRQTRVKNGVAYMTFSVQKTINSSTPTGSTALINGGAPKPILDGNATSLIVPCTVYTTGNRELVSSLTIGTTGAIDFIITREMIDIATELGTDISLQIICSFTYLVDEN